MCTEIDETLPIICKKEGVRGAWLDMQPYSSLLLRIDQIEAINVDYSKGRPVSGGPGEICPIEANTKSGHRYHLCSTISLSGDSRTDVMMRTFLKIISDAADCDGIYNIDQAALENIGLQ